MLGFGKTGGWGMLKKLSAPRAALFLAALAVVSALLTNYVTYVPNTDNFPALADTPVLPGIYFGLVICIGIFLWEERRPLKLFIVLVGVVIAWVLAYRTAISVHDFLNQFRDGDSSKLPYIFAITGLVAGLVGSLVTVIAVSLVVPDFREHGDWLRTIALGTVAGALTHFGDAPPASFLPLFIVWQVAVAASVAYGLVIPRRKRRR